MENNFIQVVIDAFGGDNAPQEIVEGAVLALNKHKELKVLLAGEKNTLETLLKKYIYDSNRVEILPSSTVITNDDSPTEAIRVKKDSSLVVALDRLRKDNQVCGLVSAGSTGAVLAGGFLKIGRLEGVSRPALAPLVPTVKGGQVLLIDCGANMDATAENLEHFALMGSLYMHLMLGIKKPKVALLNVGVEANKGNQLTKEAFDKLSHLPINFVGNMEARDTLSGEYDVIVSDGFSGNILLKSLEGGAISVSDMLKQEIKSSKKSLFGAMFMRGAFKKFKQKIDYSNKGGSPFLGAKKLIIKSHGSSDALTIQTSIEQVIDLHKSGLIQKLSEQIKELKINK